MEILSKDLLRLENIIYEITKIGEELKNDLDTAVRQRNLNYLVVIPNISTIKSLMSMLIIESISIFSKNIELPKELLELEFDLRYLIKEQDDSNNVKKDFLLDSLIIQLEELNREKLISNILDQASNEPIRII
ncbi:hypothetical protein [Staphylococcus gallinarum]|uniref:hypothetical protein n=1 Tax=Staphylococcus gallinarum TaxID=1293 RepID=UPI001E4C16A1|nr:hypothetical protein [Staphylococcus gallinarum]MCD8845213.1 hypothetical protein [Staphylococcus gallinarum]